MHAEIISIGDEIASGQRLDTNSQWLSQRLGELGVRTLYHTTVGDDLAANIEVFRAAAKRANIVIATGGLGPTADDLTRESIAEAFHLPLEVDEASLRHVESLFAKRKRAMPERNRVQAMFPRGTQVIPNPHGTAPGIDLQVPTSDSHACRIFALPGVPAEMVEMYQATVLERLKKDLGLGTRQLYYHTLKLYGIGESDVESKLPNLIDRDRSPRVGITVSRATISLRIATEAESEVESQLQRQATVDEILAAFPDLIFGEGDGLELEHAVVNQLRQQKQTLSVLEFGPHALLNPWLRQADAVDTSADETVVKGIISFQHDQQVLEWYRQESQTNPAAGVFRQLDEAAVMVIANYLREKFKTDWGLVVGPYPDIAQFGSEPAKMFPFQIGIQGPGGAQRFRSFEFGGHPDVLLHRIAKTALDQLRRELLGIPP